MFSKDIQFAVTADETDERDGSLRDVVDVRQCESAGEQNGGVVRLVDDLDRGLAFKAAVPMVSIVEEFKVLRLGSQVTVASEPLGPKEPSIIGVIEALHGSIAPRFSDGDKDHFNPQKQAEPDHHAEGARITIASSKTQCIVELNKIGDTHALPAPKQATSHRIVVFSPLRVQEDSVAAQIHDIETVKASIALDVSGAYEIGLMDIVEPQGLGKIRIFHSLGGIRSFF